MFVELSQQIIYYNINQVINVHVWVSRHFCSRDDFAPIKLNDTNRRCILRRISCAKYLQQRYSFRCESRHYLLGINCIIKLCPSAVHSWSLWNCAVQKALLLLFLFNHAITDKTTRYETTCSQIWCNYVTDVYTQRLLFHSNVHRQTATESKLGTIHKDLWQRTKFCFQLYLSLNKMDFLKFSYQVHVQHSGS